MIIQDYLLQDTREKRFIVVSNVRRANALVRSVEKSEGIHINNVEAITITDLARRILAVEASRDGFSFMGHYMESEEAAMFFRDIALKDRGDDPLIYFKEQSLFESIATSREILNKINLIRSELEFDSGAALSDKRLDGFDKDRLLDLLRLLLDYEEALKKGDGAGKRYFDNVATEIEAYNLNRGGTIKLKELLFKAFGTCKLAVLAEDKESFSTLQLGILEKIGEELDSGIQEVSAFHNTSSSVEDIDILKGKASFFKGYGAFNEAAFIANDILEKKIAFGDVHVAYTSDNQIQPISAMLKGYGIDVNFISSLPAESNPYLSLATRILDWASDRFSEKALCDIFAHPYLYYEISVRKKDDDGKSVEEKANAFNGWDYFRYVTDENKAFNDRMVLGWGYERNKEFINHITEKQRLLKEAEESAHDDKRYNRIARTDAAIEVHQALLDVFDLKPEEITLSNIFDRLFDFIKEYSRKSSERETAFGILDTAGKLLKRDNRLFELNVAIKQIKYTIEGLSDKDSETPSAVTAEKLSDWTVVNRPYLYVIGMSLKDFRGSIAESPVMNDFEINTFIKGFKPTTEQQGKRKKQAIYRTLALFNGKALSIGYSSYDAQAFFRSSPSTIYMELLEHLSDSALDDIAEFTTGNPTENVNVGRSIEDKHTFEIKTPTSSSRMDTLLYCPRQYAYENVYYVPDKKFREYNSGKWLEANERGSFFHTIAEEYANKMLIKTSSEEYDNEENEDLIKSIAKEIHKKYKNEVPAAFHEITDKEVDEIVARACDYFYSLHKELNKSSSVKRILATEVGFEDAVLTIEDLYEEEHKITYRGFIDRIDYYLDSDNKAIRLCLVDYKTGKKKTQEDKVKNEFTLQHVLYANAIETGKLRTQEGDATEKISDYILKRVSELENNEEIKNWECKVSECSFHFPMDIEGKGAYGGRPVGITELLVKEGDLIDGRLGQILSVVSREEAYIDIYQIEQLQESEDLSDKERDCFSRIKLDSNWNRCRYCDYKDMCPGRKVSVSQ